MTCMNTSVCTPNQFTCSRSVFGHACHQSPVFCSGIIFFNRVQTGDAIKPTTNVKMLSKGHSTNGTMGKKIMLGTNKKTILMNNNVQTSANTLTWYRYSKKILRFLNYLWMNLWQIVPKYSLWPRIEYLYFGQIWQIHVEAKQLCSNYSCFWPFMGQRRIVIRLWCIKHE